MSDPFETLGLPVRLSFNREELNQAFRDAGKVAHPDAGGSEQAFAQLQAAMQMLQSPARRLKAWLEHRGVEVEVRGSISHELMDEFGQVGEVTQRAEALIRKREAALSSLAKAMLENETQMCREELEATIARLESLMDNICSNFAELDQRSELNDSAVAALEWYRDLTFLEKWQASLRSLFAKLL